MRVGLVAYGLERPIGGITRYTLDLFHALSSPHLAHEITVLPLATSQRGMETLGMAERGGGLQGCRLLPGLVVLGAVQIPRIAHRLDLDVLHDPTGVTPFLLGTGPAAAVVTVHDVFAWSIPGYSTLADRLIYRHWLPHLLPRVDTVITISETSKADLIRYLHLDPARIRVIYRCVSDSYRIAPHEIVEKVKAKYRLPNKYLLFVGSTEKRKNLPRLLQAYGILTQRGNPPPLVVVGAPRFAHSSSLVADLGLQDRVIFTGYIPDADLPAIYSGATLFLFPSLYEGFGLPPLEAMACGTPVVCSNTSSLPEVVGDAAVMVDPYDVPAMADGIERVLGDPDLQEELRRRGLERAAQFTWERAARQTVEVYRKVLGR